MPEGSGTAEIELGKNDTLSITSYESGSLTVTYEIASVSEEIPKESAHLVLHGDVVAT
jgi:hypothetical protein